jgi:hypothetical protein
MDALEGLVGRRVGGLQHPVELLLTGLDVSYLRFQRPATGGIVPYRLVGSEYLAHGSIAGGGTLDLLLGCIVRVRVGGC